MIEFTPGELEVIEVLWKHGSLKPAEIQDHLKRPISNAALRSVLRVLLEKGHVTRRKKGKAYYYRARRTAPAAFRSMTARLADMFCGGSSFNLIAQLIRTEQLSEDDIQALKALAESKTSDRASSEDETAEKGGEA